MPQRIGQYQLIDMLNQTPLGATYIASGKVNGHGTEQRVLIHVLQHASGDRRAQIQRLQRLQVHGVAPVLEHLESRDAVVMPYTHGLSLRAMLQTLQRAGEQFSTDAAIDLGARVAEALHWASTARDRAGHPLQLFHGCLLPEDIILTPDGDVTLHGFGLLTSGRDRQHTQDTVGYQSPEQATGHLGDAFSDQFCLGLILYEALLREPAYARPVRLQDVQAGNLSVQRQRVASLLPAVGHVIARMLHPRSEKRYPTCGAAAADLRLSIRQHPLHEFCEWFFIELYDLGAPPGLASTPAPTRAPEPQRRPAPPPEPAPAVDLVNQTVGLAFPMKGSHNRLETHPLDGANRLRMETRQSEPSPRSDHIDPAVTTFGLPMAQRRQQPTPAQPPPPPPPPPVVDQKPMPPTEKDSRTTRVLVLLFAVFAMVCVTSVLAVFVILNQLDKSNNPDVTVDATQDVGSDNDPDTGDFGDLDNSIIRNPGGTGTAAGGGTGTSSSGRRGRVSVTISRGASAVSELQSQCAGRIERAPMRNNRAQVPVSGSNCVLFFKGPALNGQYGPVQSGQSLRCEVRDTVVTCR